MSESFANVTMRIFHATLLCLLFSSHHFASLHLTSLRLPFFLHHFTSLRATLLRLPSVFPASLHATSLHPHFVCFTSRHFVPLHLASGSFYITSPHFMPLHVTFHSFCITSPHFVPLCFSPPFSPPHFTLLHFI